MNNGENEKEDNNLQNISDLNDLFQRTYEFDIFKYVSRGLIKSQQNYETKLTELKLENLKTKKELSLLKDEIELLKGNINKPIQENKNEKNNLDIDIQNLTDELENKKQNNKNLGKFDTNKEGYNNINYNLENNSSKNRKRRNGTNSDFIKDEHMNSNDIEENKYNEEKEGENSNESMIKMTNTFINELVNENKIKKNKIENNYYMGKMNNQNNLINENLNIELINIKSKLDEIYKQFNQFKFATNRTISESAINIKTNLSDNLLKLKEESKKELISFNEGINQKIIKLNDTTKNLTEKNEENEKLMNKTNSLNSTFLGKLDLLKSKFVEYVSNSDFKIFQKSIYEKFENEIKDLNIDISFLKKSVNSLKSEILNFSNDTNDHETIILLKQKQESTSALVEKLLEFQKGSKEKERKDFFFDASKFVDIETFNEFQRNQTKIMDKIKRENIDLGREFTEIKMVDLNNKASLKDLKNLEDNILIKMEDLMNKIKEKFVEKKSLDKYLRFLEYRTQQILEEFKLELKPGHNWLLAKKPVGHLCASCETYLGEIVKTPREKTNNTWKKYLNKASGDNKNININVGFSKVIQMAKNNEKEKEKYISLPVSKTNVYNGRHNSCSDKKRFGENEDMININKSSNTSKINKLNLENNNTSQTDDYETDIFNGALPQIKNKIINMNLPEEKKIIKRSIKSLKDMIKNKENDDNSDFIIMMKPEQRKKGKLESGPKITKILKKLNRNIINDNQLNNESKKSNEE